MNRKSICALLVSLVCANLFAQSAPIETSKPTFHIEGTFNSPSDVLPKNIVIRRDNLDSQGQRKIKVMVDGSGKPTVVVPPTEITFRGEQVTKTVALDDQGFYQAELPVGSYKMTVVGPGTENESITPYVRFFRIMQGTRVVINGNLYLEPATCDNTVRGAPEEQSRQPKDACGGEDVFPVPSTYGMPWELHISFPQRQTNGDSYVYSTNNVTRPGVPVVLTYNLCSLEADKVSYDAKRRMITASGVVVTQDGTGKTHRGDSMNFVLSDDGQFIPVR